MGLEEKIEGLGPLPYFEPNVIMPQTVSSSSSIVNKNEIEGFCVVDTSQVVPVELYFSDLYFSKVSLLL